MWKVVAFYTSNSPYEQVYEQYLKPSLERFNIESIIVQTENTHNWKKNVAQKPKIILDTLESVTHDLVVLDADATIERYPELFDKLPATVDLAVHYLDWSTWYKNNSSIKELLSGTMFIRNNDKMKALCRRWYQDAINTSAWEQKVLEALIEKTKKEGEHIEIYELPLDYIYINSLPQGQSPHVKIDNPYIVHHQVSREFRKRGRV